MKECAEAEQGCAPANVLLAGLQREAVRLAAIHVAGLADHPARDGTLVLVLAREEGRMRAAVAERHTETLRHGWCALMYWL